MNTTGHRYEAEPAGGDPPLDARSTRSTVEFRVRHFWGLITWPATSTASRALPPSLPGPKIELTIEANSLDTGRRQRDKHLRSADFFEVVAFPQTRFTSTRIVDTGEGTLQVTGELQAAGKRVPLVFDAKIDKAAEELQIEATTTVDHRLLDMTWSPLGAMRSPSALHVKARLK